MTERTSTIDDPLDRRRGLVGNTLCGVILPGSKSPARDDAETALAQVHHILVHPGAWVCAAKRYVMGNECPGDCLYLPPAVLLDLDNTLKHHAHHWLLRVAMLDNHDADGPFVHAWLVYRQIAVSISSLSVGRPAMAIPVARYESANRIIEGPVRVTRRRLRRVASAAGIGCDLARWIADHVDNDIR